MDKKLFKYELIGFIFVNILGTLDHFVYNWTGNNIIAALFCPVNESVWEHLKLLYFPFIIYTIFELAKMIDKDKINSFLFGKILGIEIGMFSTLAIHYVYMGAIGKESLAVDIISFIIGILIAYFISYIIVKNSIGNSIPKLLTIALLTIQGIILIAFTFIPPYLPIFMDSQTLTYGI